jgi:glutaredoxin
MRAALVFAAMCLAAFAANAQMYQWTDQSGRTHITGTPPPPDAKNVKKIGGATPAEGGKEASVGGAEPYVLQVARKSYPITLYTTPGCEACTEARKLLNGRGLPFKEVSVTSEDDIAALKKVAGSASVPSMVVGSTVQRGFEEGGYNRVLDAAGYPKAGILPPRDQTEPQPVEPAAPEVKPAPLAEQPRGPYSPPPYTEPTKPEAKK